MFVDALEVADRATVSCDLCVIGAGAAGIALAREFLGTPWTVVVLESGGLELETRAQELNAGVVDAEDVEADYLTRTRLRVFGGTTMVWMGYCRPLDEVDFEAKPWLPDYPGWPFGRRHLEPYYDRAAEVVQTPPFFRDRQAREPFVRRDVRLEALPFHLSPPTYFGRAYREEFARSRNVTTYLHATARELVPAADRASLERAEVASPGGRTFQVAARRFVICAGGIESARLLLDSDRLTPGGIGNGRDLVGRFFMSHFPTHPFGQAIFTHPQPDELLHSLMSPWVHYVALREEVLRRERLLNAGFHFNPGFGPEAPGKSPEAMREVFPHFENALRGTTGFAILPASAVPEQAPNAESRVLLTPERNASGARRVKLRFRRSPADLESLRRSAEFLGRELGRQGLGRLQTAFLDGGGPVLRPDDHHMGATRMHADPTRGVVDPECRVHGMRNLFVASSSVFPSGGFANPTLTIIALALRLADHLKAGLK